MSDISVSPEAAQPRLPTLTRFVPLLFAASVLARRASGFGARTLRTGAMLVQAAMTGLMKAIGSIRLPVSHAMHMRVTRQLERFEVQAIASVRSIECREKRARALLALARTAYEIGRDNGAFLKATLEELQAEHYWQRKQQRIFSAAQLACSVAGLAAMSGHAVIGNDAYLCGQGYNSKVEGVDRKIGLAVAFADVAALFEASYDHVAWLATAMDLACGIAEHAERIGAVNFVARKMVIDRIPPCDNHVVDKRFAVDMSAMTKVLVPAAAEKAAAPGKEYDEFSIVM